MSMECVHRLFFILCSRDHQALHSFPTRRSSDLNLQFNADTDVALLNAMLHTIVEEGLANEAFIRDRTSGYEALAENVKKRSEEHTSELQSRRELVCRLLLEKKKDHRNNLKKT